MSDDSRKRRRTGKDGDSVSYVSPPPLTQVASSSSSSSSSDSSAPTSGGGVQTWTNVQPPMTGLVSEAQNDDHEESESDEKFAEPLTQEQKAEQQKPPFPVVFMNFAMSLAQRSGDYNSRVGCVITNLSNQVVGIGYNGHPYGGSTESANESVKKKIMVHAEMNALTHASSAVLAQCGLIVYTTRSPCVQCMKTLSQCNTVAVFCMYLCGDDIDTVFQIANGAAIPIICMRDLFAERWVSSLNIEMENCETKRTHLEGVFKEQAKIQESGISHYDPDLNASTTNTAVHLKRICCPGSKVIPDPKTKHAFSNKVRYPKKDLTKLCGLLRVTKRDMHKLAVQFTDLDTFPTSLQVQKHRNRLFLDNSIKMSKK